MDQTKKPNLFIIGAAKCGTTSLWNILAQHEEVFMCTPKEPSFFSFADHLERLQDYEKLFERVGSETVIGEASPIYSETTLIPDIASRISSYNPNAKIIYIVREPISRIKSVWRQALGSGHWYKPKLREYCDVDVPLMPKNFIKAIYQYPSFLEGTKYWTHLSNYRRHFSDDQILVLFFEDLKADPVNLYNKLCKFLSISVDDRVINNLTVRHNDSQGKTRYKPWVAFLKQNKMVSGLYKKIQMYTNINLRKYTKEEIDYEVHLPLEERDKILSLLQDDLSKILSYGGKRAEFWNL